MKEEDIRLVESWGYELHDCRRGPDGRCYYLVSQAPEAFGGDYQGAIFHAYAESKEDGKPTLELELEFLVSDSTLRTSRTRAQIGHYETFIKKKGLENLVNLLSSGLDPDLDRDPAGPHPFGTAPFGGEGQKYKKHRIMLTTSSSADEFAISEPTDAVPKQIALRQEMLQILVATQLQDNRETVPRREVEAKLCAPPFRVREAFRVLEEEGMIDVSAENSIGLTGAGRRAAEGIASTSLQKSIAAIAQQKISEAKEPSLQVFDEIQSVIRNAPEISEDGSPSGIGHNHPPEILEQVQEAALQGAAAVGAAKLDRDQLINVKNELSAYKVLCLQKFSETMGDQAAKWFWRLLAALLAHVTGILDQIIAWLPLVGN